MSDHSLNAVFFSPPLSSLAGGAFAVTPSARFESRMVWDTASTVPSSSVARPPPIPERRCFMSWATPGNGPAPAGSSVSPRTARRPWRVLDDLRLRPKPGVIFGGRQQKVDINETWSYDGNTWTQLQPANSPAVRELPGMAYDSTRDRIVVFGGNQLSYINTGRTLVETPSTTPGSSTARTGTRSLRRPAVTKPILEYDQVRKQTIMIGYDTKINTVMYAYDPVAVKWNQLTPATLPACANEGR